MRFALIMRGTSSPLAPQVTPAWLARVAAAVTIQLNAHLSPTWGGDYALRVSDGTDLVAGEIAFSLVDVLPDAPNAIAFHDVDGNDAAYALLGLSTVSTLDDVSTAISHECCETAGDIGCNLWADDGAGHEYARELCDAVEGNRYYVDLGDGQAPIAVSDFVLPAFFDALGKGPFSYMQSVPSVAAPVPATLAAGPFLTALGGYQIQRTGAGPEKQVQAAANGASARGARAAMGAHHWSSRPARRGVPRQVAP